MVGESRLETNGANCHLKWQTKQAGRITTDSQRYDLEVLLLKRDKKSPETLRLAPIQNGAESC